MEVRKCKFRPQRFREQASSFWASAVTVQLIWFYSNSDSERPPALILRKVLMGKIIKMGTSGGSIRPSASDKTRSHSTWLGPVSETYSISPVGLGPYPFQDNAATIYTIANTGATLM
jgi:hypothetical protein